MLIVAVWIVWVRKMVVDRPLVTKSVTALVVFTAGVWILSMFLPVYIEALTVVALPLSRLLLYQSPYALSVSGHRVVMNFQSFTFNTNVLSSDVYNQLIFLSLMATLFVKGKMFEIARLTVYGAGAIFLLSIGHLVLYILGVSHRVSPATFDVIDGTVFTFMLSFCIGIYIFFTHKLRSSRKQQPLNLEGGRINEKDLVFH